MTVALMTIGLVSVVFGTLTVGEGPSGLRPFAACGTVAAEGPRVGNWSFAPDACRSGASKGIDGMLLYDASTHDRQLALIHDAASGNVLDAMVEREHRTRRFFPRDCRVLKVDLRPMDSAVNRITNLRGELDAECEAAGDRLSAPCHVPVLPLTSAAIRCGRIWTPARPEAVRLVPANKTAATEPRCALSQPAAREARALIEMCPR